MSEQDTSVLMSVDELRKLFREVKSVNLTQAQFEREKTQRIAAICGALSSPTSQPYQGQLMEMLNHVHHSSYSFQSFI